MSVRSPKITKRLKHTAPPPPKLSLQPNPSFVRTTAEMWPASKDHLEKLGIPLGATFHPFAHPLEQDGVMIQFTNNSPTNKANESFST